MGALQQVRSGLHAMSPKDVKTGILASTHMQLMYILHEAASLAANQSSSGHKLSRMDGRAAIAEPSIDTGVCGLDKTKRGQHTIEWRT